MGQEIETCYRQRGWKTDFQMKAVWTEDMPNKTVYTDPSDTHEGWGNGLTTAHIGNKEAMVEDSVPAVDIAAFIREKVEMYRPLNVLLKMDIEGTEHEVLPHMLKRGILCRNFVNAAFIEWHSSAGFKSSLSGGALSSLMQHQACASTKIIGMDDESYRHDKKDLPEGC